MFWRRPSCLDRGGATLPLKKEAERLAYNQKVKNRAAIYDYTVLEYATIPAMAVSGGPNYADWTHPNSVNVA